MTIWIYLFCYFAVQESSSTMKPMFLAWAHGFFEKRVESQSETMAEKAGLDSVSGLSAADL